MAKARRIRRAGLGSKKFFSLVVLSVSALGLLFTANYALQQQTSTESQAMNKYCTYEGFRPILKQTAVKEAKNSITYTLKVVNKSDIKCDESLYFGFKDQTVSYSWRFLYYKGDKLYDYDPVRFKSNNGRGAPPIGYLRPAERTYYKLKIEPSSNTRNISYTIPVKVCWLSCPGGCHRLYPDKYYALRNNYMTTNCSKVKLKYTKTGPNKLDLAQ